MMARSASFGRSLPTLFVVMTLALAGVPWFVVRYREAWEAARDADCRGQLYQYGFALRNYYDAHGSFPLVVTVDDQGRPMFSWRAAAFQEWTGHPLNGVYRFDVPWDDPANAAMSSYDTSGFFYWCPSGNGRQTKATDYVAVIGPHTAWPEGRGLRLDEITDGPENTILVVEVDDSGILWMESRDFSMEEILDRGGSRRHAGWFNALFADGRVRKIRQDVDRQTLKALLTIDGGESVDPRSWEHP
ncbi:DUF1559 family PulG-like putative transporter [Paludisphaera rhizosphaerae]|uniref:DUF1559 family PulG-like putative transporter n=1 Tax=Paludisphaera rhizosphaerae TaxID=2711216 RepID=UPI0013EDD721|nr:DUF1559 domain-containing protein [Paludisphaera rhizosphaerae]